MDRGVQWVGQKVDRSRRRQGLKGPCVGSKQPKFQVLEMRCWILLVRIGVRRVKFEQRLPSSRASAKKMLRLDSRHVPSRRALWLVLNSPRRAWLLASTWLGACASLLSDHQEGSRSHIVDNNGSAIIKVTTGLLRTGMTDDLIMHVPAIDRWQIIGATVQ